MTTGTQNVESGKLVCTQTSWNNGKRMKKEMSFLDDYPEKQFDMICYQLILIFWLFLVSRERNLSISIVVKYCCIVFFFTRSCI